jgi:hypothetical protein
MADMYWDISSLRLFIQSCRNSDTFCSLEMIKFRNEKKPAIRAAVTAPMAINVCGVISSSGSGVIIS